MLATCCALVCLTTALCSVMAQTLVPAMRLHSLIGRMKYLESEKVGNKAAMGGIDHWRTGKYITGTLVLYNTLCRSECFYIYHLIYFL